MVWAGRDEKSCGHGAQRCCAPTNLKPARKKSAFRNDRGVAFRAGRDHADFFLEKFGDEAQVLLARLPKAAEQYLRFISEFLEVEIGMISTGPERDATIIPEGTLLSRWL